MADLRVVPDEGEHRDEDAARHAELAHSAVTKPGRVRVPFRPQLLAQRVSEEEERLQAARIR